MKDFIYLTYYYLTQLATAYEVKYVTHMKTRLVSPFKVWALIASSLFPFNPLSMMRTRMQRLVNIATNIHRVRCYTSYSKMVVILVFFCLLAN